MTKDELIKVVAEETKLTQKNTFQAISALFQTIEQSLKQQVAVTVVGFGTFKTVNKSARQGRNPRTGEPISIPARTVPAFTPGKGLKEAMNT